jgi:hypothetical protein
MALRIKRKETLRSSCEHPDEGLKISIYSVLQKMLLIKIVETDLINPIWDLLFFFNLKSVRYAQP